MTQPTIIHLIRHGEVHNPTNILYGRLPRYHLSINGQQQAQAAAETLRERPLAAIYHSPMLRAKQTAQAIATPHGLKPRQTQLLNEIDSPYQGHTIESLEAIAWRIYDDIPAQYETPVALIQRIERFFQQIRRRHHGQEVAAVTHGDILLHARIWAEGWEPSYENRMKVSQPYPATASLNTYTFNADDEPPTFRYHVPY